MIAGYLFSRHADRSVHHRPRGGGPAQTLLGIMVVEQRDPRHVHGAVGPDARQRPRCCATALSMLAIGGIQVPVAWVLSGIYGLNGI
ncbi:MAG: hypothetical protein IPH64_06675 [Comamonadaceae bacterium]|nr:hypothetical protein [Comamonadaceae bacterium]